MGGADDRFLQGETACFEGGCFFSKALEWSYEMHVSCSCDIIVIIDSHLPFLKVMNISKFW